ncbi:hypothetical protein KM043_003134 [Ampulex compressa]|nr:hypothetical protein KM043_003134 [Ampulex compressa]
MTENLFFAIFGQKDTNDFTVLLKRNMQPSWTIYLFKVFFSLYMLVSVIVLINLLIAMMSDTYHSIQSQSDIEWKFGLSKLIRKMQKTRTAPSPLNLVSSWTTYLVNVYTARANKNAKTSKEGSLFERHPAPSGNSLFPRAGRTLPTVPPDDKIDLALRASASFGSQTSLKSVLRIDNVVEWERVRQKYRMRFGDEVEKPSREEPASLDGMH